MTDWRYRTKKRMYYIKNAFAEKKEKIKIQQCEFNRQLGALRDKKKIKAYFEIPNTNDMICITGVDVLND